MYAASTSETSINFYQTTWCNNPEDSHLHTCCHENVKSHSLSKMLDINMAHHSKDITALSCHESSNIFSNVVTHITRLSHNLAPVSCFNSKKINENRNTYNGLPLILQSGCTLLSDHTQLLGDSCWLHILTYWGLVQDTEPFDQPYLDGICRTQTSSSGWSESEANPTSQISS
jgi:hypothetical protein